MDNLSLHWAQALLARGSEKVRLELNKTACISVCDRYGFLVGFVRMDGAPVRSIQLAQQKAYTCTRMGSTTDAFLARLRKDDVPIGYRSEEHTSELQVTNAHPVCRLLLEK